MTCPYTAKGDAVQVLGEDVLRSTALHLETTRGLPFICLIPAIPSFRLTSTSDHGGSRSRVFRGSILNNAYGINFREGSYTAADFGGREIACYDNASTVDGCYSNLPLEVPDPDDALDSVGALDGDCSGLSTLMSRCSMTQPTSKQCYSCRAPQRPMAKFCSQWSQHDATRGLCSLWRCNLQTALIDSVGHHDPTVQASSTGAPSLPDPLSSLPAPPPQEHSNQKRCPSRSRKRKATYVLRRFRRRLWIYRDERDAGGRCRGHHEYGLTDSPTSSGEGGTIDNTSVTASWPSLCTSFLRDDGERAVRLGRMQVVLGELVEEIELASGTKLQMRTVFNTGQVRAGCRWWSRSLYGDGRCGELGEPLRVGSERARVDFGSHCTPCRR